MTVERHAQQQMIAGQASFHKYAVATQEFRLDGIRAEREIGGMADAFRAHQDRVANMPVPARALAGMNGEAHGRVDAMKRENVIAHVIGRRDLLADAPILRIFVADKIDARDCRRDLILAGSQLESDGQIEKNFSVRATESEN